MKTLEAVGVIIQEKDFGEGYIDGFYSHTPGAAPRVVFTSAISVIRKLQVVEFMKAIHQAVTTDSEIAEIARSHRFQVEVPTYLVSAPVLPLLKAQLRAQLSQIRQE